MPHSPLKRRESTANLARPASCPALSVKYPNCYLLAAGAYYRWQPKLDNRLPEHHLLGSEKTIIR